MADTSKPLYCSAVAGHHVTRYGTRTLIGAEIDLQHPGNIRWDTNKIVVIPAAEYELHRLEYDRLLADGALKRRTAAEYKTAQAAVEKAFDDAAAKAKDEAEKAERKANEAAEKAAAEAEPDDDDQESE
jgi:hypothetical protein